MYSVVKRFESLEKLYKIESIFIVLFYYVLYILYTFYCMMDSTTPTPTFSEIRAIFPTLISIEQTLPVIKGILVHTQK